MGFELNRIMQQYGVGTPGRINYSGATPVDPGARPVASDTLSGEALTKAQADHDALVAKYNLDQKNAPLDTAAYDAYKKEYQTRLMNTPMYMQSQFQTGYEPKSAGLQYAENNMGVKQFNKNIQDWAAQNPNAYSTQINAIADKYGVGAQDIYNATQNRWGNVLQAPTYGSSSLITPVKDTVVGGGGNDTVVGGGGGGGGGGTDTIVGGGGNDTIVGGGTNDTIVGGGTNDTIVGGGTNDTLVGGGTNDTLVGGGTNDTLVGGGTNDTLVGGGTNDTLVGGGTNDTLVGGGTNDTLIGGGTNDTLVGGGTNDTLIGGGTNDTLIGGGTNDTLVGGGNNDTITGGGNNDSILTTLSTITGGAGNDTVVGGNNNDSVLTNLSTVTGGAGNDLVADDGTTGGILSTIANLNNTTGTDTVTGGAGSVTGGAGNDNVIGTLSADDINRLNETYLNSNLTGTTGTTGTTGSDSLGNLVTVDQNTDNTTLDGLSGYLNNNNNLVDNTLDTTSTAQNLVSNLNAANTGAGSTLNSNVESATDLGNGLFAVDNGDGTQSIFTDDGTAMGSVGGGLEAVQDWEGNKTLTGIPNVSVQGGNDDIGAVNDLFYYPDTLEQQQRLEDFYNLRDIGGFNDGGYCPAPWINILLADGGTVKAGDIKPGMEVYTRHETTNEWGVYPVSAVEMSEDERWEVLLEDGRSFVGSPNHRVHTGEDWTEIHALKAGDKLVQPEGFGVVKSSAKLDHGPVVKITVTGAHTYISEGFLSHNIKMIDFGGGGGYGGGMLDDISWGAMAYAKGGPVKTHYQTAGSVSLPEGYINPEDEIAQATPVNMIDPPPPVITEPKAPLATIAMKNAPAPAAPVAVAPKSPAPFGDERMANIQALLAAYGPKDTAYGEDLKAARASAKAESDAFAKMLSGAMKSPEDEQSSKAEMYFRLAAAFGAPTKTGHFAENLGMVGKELGEYSKNKRASAQQKLALALEGQKMKMTAAKEDLNTLRGLAGEEMKDKRAIATELIKDYIKSGEPQSSAGKQALDEGLKPGTPEYQKRVEAIGNMNIEGKLAQITASLAGMNTAAANLALAQEKFQNQKTQQAKLTGPELKLKTETEETLAQTDQALVNLKKAYALNPNTFDTSLVDVTQRKLLEAGGSKDPKVAATREMENLLEKAALSQLKATFPGAISNDERKALQDVQGLGAKSKEERARIMKNGYAALKAVSERHRKRLNEINSGLYRDTAAPSIDEGND